MDGFDADLELRLLEPARATLAAFDVVGRTHELDLYFETINQAPRRLTSACVRGAVKARG